MFHSDRLKYTRNIERNSVTQAGEADNCSKNYNCKTCSSKNDT